MAHDPDLDPILKDLRGADAALAQRLDGIAARLERLEAAPPAPAQPAPEAAELLPAAGGPAGFSKIGGFLGQTNALLQLGAKASHITNHLQPHARCS